jgi:hypothetical protein
MGMGEQHIVDAQHVVAREVTHACTGVQQQAVVHQEGGGFTASRNRA